MPRPAAQLTESGNAALRAASAPRGNGDAESGGDGLADGLPQVATDQLQQVWGQRVWKGLVCGGGEAADSALRGNGDAKSGGDGLVDGLPQVATDQLQEVWEQRVWKGGVGQQVQHGTGLWP
eukprot:364626-Chlamydomonas_euryale.AAC.8